MKVYIFVDMEGISGISSSEFVKTDGLHYNEGRKYYTMDINACIKGCLKAGITDIIVRDGHGAGNHTYWNEIDSHAELIQGATPKQRLPGIEEADALILLGYHAMAGTQEALLEHTYSSGTIQNMWLNGNLIGEFGIDSAVAADYNVPTIMVSGDDKVCIEAQQWIPDVVTCQVKKSYACQSTRLLPIEKAHALIEEKTTEAIGKINDIKLPQFERPVTLRRELVERGVVSPGPGRTIIDGRTAEVTGKTTEEALFML